MMPEFLPTDPVEIEKIRQRFGKFMLQSVEHGECMVWIGYRDKDGYGRFRIGEKVHRANKVAYWLEYGEWLEDGWEVCHKCDNPPCCRGEHLFKGTKSDNMKDRAEKGRQAGGRAGTGAGTGNVGSDNRRMDELIERIFNADS